MTNLRYVWCWPNSGLRDGMWDPERSRAVDLFARTSRRVTERYSEGLSVHEIPSARTAIKIMLIAAHEPTDDVVVNVALKPFEGNETVRVDLPARIADLEAAERGLMVLDVVGAAMGRLAQLRGWHTSPFEQVRQHVLDHHLAFEVAGPSKLNRTRDRRARPILRINDDGWGEKAFEIADAKSGRVLGFTQTEVTPTNSEPSFNRDIRKWRWADSSMIECPEGWQIRPDSEWGRLTRYDATDLGAWPTHPEPVPRQSPLHIRVQDI